ncbi:MAG TPA: DUF1329 domain-containing protein [Myxococcales bacterium]|nr:DUF1329 domain-containing protein [Myxococcales bacterium]HIL00928.1 DUF1329 domain-containing protein [Myxococcales bacterium]
MTSLLLALPSFAAPPDEGECPSISPRGPDGRPDTDATPMIVKEGMKVSAEGLLALQTLLPREVWRHRESFFFEGMLMEIGPCHRRYPLPRFFLEATDKHAAGVVLDDEGNLSNYVAGVPFPQASIDPDDPMAATRWAWNLEKRFRGAGYRGRFRITDFPTRMGAVMRYEGKFFAFQAAGRADLAETDYRSPDTKNLLWATGGQFTAPFGARELAWRQFRSPGSETRWGKPDDVFVYIPSLRKTRRSGTPWVDGAFMPRYSVADQSQGGGGMALSGGVSIQPGAGPSLAVSENARAGLTGLYLRPNAYRWRIRGEQTVIAPLNGQRQGWPVTQGRNYGTSGLSVAADRWDVRQAVVIEGISLQRSETIRTITIYIDYQTLQPLYWISHTGKKRLVEVGILVHRFSGDRPEEQRWPDDSPNRVFEPVAASFVNALAGRGGWLRESHSLESLPFTPSAVKRMTTTSALDRGH